MKSMSFDNYTIQYENDIPINEDTCEGLKYLDFKWNDKNGFYIFAISRLGHYVFLSSTDPSSKFPGIILRMYGWNGLNGMMMCLDHVQKWLDFRHTVFIFLHWTQFLLSEINLRMYGMMMSPTWKPYYAIKEKGGKPMAEGRGGITYIKH